MFFMKWVQSRLVLGLASSELPRRLLSPHKVSPIDPDLFLFNNVLS